jgi:hypothetical protein
VNGGMKAFHGYDAKMLLSDYLEAVVTSVLEFPDEEHRIEFPGQGIMIITPARLDEWVKDTREFIAVLQDDAGQNVPIGWMR